MAPEGYVLDTSAILTFIENEAGADRRYALMKRLPSEILWQIDEPILLTASRLKAGHRLSLADSLIAAFAQREDATLVHKDPEFEVLAEQVKLEALPYKKGKSPESQS